MSANIFALQNSDYLQLTVTNVDSLCYDLVTILLRLYESY